MVAAFPGPPVTRMPVDARNTPMAKSQVKNPAAELDGDLGMESRDALTSVRQTDDNRQ